MTLTKIYDNGERANLINVIFILRHRQSNLFSRLNGKQGGNKTVYKSDINSLLLFFVPQK